MLLRVRAGKELNEEEKRELRKNRVKDVKVEGSASCKLILFIIISKSIRY